MTQRYDNMDKQQLIDALVKLGYVREPLEQSSFEDVKTQAGFEGIINILQDFK